MNVAYCALAAAQEGLPGWHMFESAPDVALDLVDRDGAVMDVRRHLPRGAYVTERREVERVFAFVCARHPNRAPFELVDRRTAERRSLGRGCEPHGAR